MQNANLGSSHAMLRSRLNCTRRTFFHNSLATVFAALALGAPKSGSSPNFVIALADDLGYGDLGIYGSPTIRTPNLDQMAMEGVKLTSFYAAPTCTPSRAMLLTGRYAIRSGLIRPLYPRENFGLPECEITLAEALKQLGYATALIGKWHLGDRQRYRPLRHGFDYYYGLLYSNDMTLPSPYLRRLRLYRNNESIESPVNQNTLTKRYTEETIKFIEQNKDKPFFIYLAHTMPHYPQHASKAFRGKSGRGIYGDAVEEIDWSMGEILSTLKAEGLDGKTLVAFSSDNGPALGRRRHGGSAGPLQGGKKTTWEGGVRVPFIARWPGHIPPGLVQGGIASLMDLYPTLIELAGGKVPTDWPIDGKNIMPLLKGKSGSPHSQYIYYEGTEISAIRSGDWKLHFGKADTGPKGSSSPQKCDPPELYNLAEDPGEILNVAQDNPDVVARLTALAKEFQDSVVPGKLPPKRRLLP